MAKRGGGRSSRSSSSRSRSKGRSSARGKGGSSGGKSSKGGRGKGRSTSSAGKGGTRSGSGKGSSGRGTGSKGTGGTSGTKSKSTSGQTSARGNRGIGGTSGIGGIGSRLGFSISQTKAQKAQAEKAQKAAEKAQKVAAEKSAFSIAATGFNTAFGPRQPDSKLSKTQSTGTFTSWHDSGTMSNLQAAIDRSKEANPAAWGQVTGERVNLGTFTSALTEAKEKSFDRTHQINLNPAHVSAEGKFNLVEATKGFFAKHTAFVLTPEASATSDVSAEISAVPTTDQKQGIGLSGISATSIAGDAGGALGAALSALHIYFGEARNPSGLEPISPTAIRSSL